MNVFTGQGEIPARDNQFPPFDNDISPKPKPTRRNIMSDSGNPIEWEVISTYTRKQALEDGSLIDVTAYARMRGFTVPTAIPAILWIFSACCRNWLKLASGNIDHLNAMGYAKYIIIYDSYIYSIILIHSIHHRMIGTTCSGLLLSYLAADSSSLVAPIAAAISRSIRRCSSGSEILSDMSISFVVE